MNSVVVYPVMALIFLLSWIRLMQSEDAILLQFTSPSSICLNITLVKSVMNSFSETDRGRLSAPPHLIRLQNRSAWILNRVSRNDINDDLCLVDQVKE